jgi:hypothetical protein
MVSSGSVHFTLFAPFSQGKPADDANRYTAKARSAIDALPNNQWTCEKFYIE